MQATYFKGDVLLLKKCGNTLKINDIVYIKFQESDTTNSPTYFFQRIIGLPGDSLEIIDKEVYVNSKFLKDTSTIKHNYYLKSTIKLDSVNRVKFNLTEGDAISEKNDYSFSLTKLQVDTLKKMQVIDGIEPETETKNNFDISCFPYSTYYKWNMDNYGKIYIPKKNDLIKLDTINICFYKTLIEEYEKNTLEIKSDSIFINKKLTTTYCVKQNYYFTLGDNRDNANDSRKWGFLPENFIVGKCVWLIKHDVR